MLTKKEELTTEKKRKYTRKKVVEKIDKVIDSCAPKTTGFGMKDKFKLRVKN